MGFLIDQGDISPPALTNAGTRTTRDSAAGATLAAGRNTQPNRTHYAGGGSGESTGGSASIF
jgi:hypothetical protein